MSVAKPVQDAPSISQILAMARPELQELHRHLFGKKIPAGNIEHARRKIGWHIQAAAEGGLPEPVRQHALGIARAQKLQRVLELNQGKRSNGIDLSNAVSGRVHLDHDSRIPLPGSVLVKRYGNKTHVVHVLVSGFEYDGARFLSLSSVANQISGSRWNGYVFFGLQKGGVHAR